MKYSIEWFYALVSGKLVREGRFDEVETLVREAADIVKEIRG